MPQKSLRWLHRPLSTWSQFLFLWSSPCQIRAPGSSLLLWFSLRTRCLCLVTLRFDCSLSLVQFSLDYPWTLPEPSWLTTGLVQPLPHHERGTGQFECQMLEPAFPWDKPININRSHRSMWLKPWFFWEFLHCTYSQFPCESIQPQQSCVLIWRTDAYGSHLAWRCGLKC